MSFALLSLLISLLRAGRFFGAAHFSRDYADTFFRRAEGYANIFHAFSDAARDTTRTLLIAPLCFCLRRHAELLMAPMIISRDFAMPLRLDAAPLMPIPPDYARFLHIFDTDARLHFAFFFFFGDARCDDAPCRARLLLICARHAAIAMRRC